MLHLVCRRRLFADSDDDVDRRDHRLHIPPEKIASRHLSHPQRASASPTRSQAIISSRCSCGEATNWGSRGSFSTATSHWRCDRCRDILYVRNQRRSVVHEFWQNRPPRRPRLYHGMRFRNIPPTLRKMPVPRRARPTQVAVTCSSARRWTRTRSGETELKHPIGTWAATSCHTTETATTPLSSKPTSSTSTSWSSLTLTPPK